MFAALAPAPVSSDAVSRPLMTRVSTPTLKNEMNFSWASISLRAADVDFGRHVEHRMLSQSSVIRPENRQGRDASGVVFSENIWTYLRADREMVAVPCDRTFHDLPVHAVIGGQLVFGRPTLRD